MVFTFSVLYQKNPFWANLVKKIKIVCLSGNLVPRLIWLCRIQWVHFFSFLLEIPFWANLIQKIKIVSLSWNFKPNLFEDAELCRKYVVITFSVLDQKNSFWKNLVKKNQNCQFKLKFGTKTNLSTRFFYKQPSCLGCDVKNGLKVKHLAKQKLQKLLLASE